MMILFKGAFGLLLNLLVLNHGCSQSLQVDDSTICWQEGRDLTWGNFQGKPDTIITQIGTPATAVIAAPIRYQITQLGNNVSIKVKVEFLKNKSWVTDTTNELGLKHEQLHFDIAELYGRKIRKEVQELNASGVYDIDSITNRVKILVQEKNKTNSQYDKKTGHGIVDFKQQEWNEKIAKELEELEEYASSEEDCEENLD